jgi:penicillin-binding protein 2
MSYSMDKRLPRSLEARDAERAPASRASRWRPRTCRSGVASLALIAVGGLGLLWFPRSSEGNQADEGSQPTAIEWRLLPSLRGEILDRNGIPLAENRYVFNIYVAPRRFSPEVRARLIDLLDLTEEEVARLDGRLARPGDPLSGRMILALEDQGRARARLVDGARRDLGGAVEAHHDPYRRYPHGELAAHIVGYVDSASERELAELGLPADASELVGRRGVEEALHPLLRGKSGVERFITSAEGERIASDEAEGIIGRPTFEAPVAGHDVVLTLDLRVQRSAVEAVKEHAAAAVVVAEVETGRILALVSTPSFDPNAMSGPGAAARRALLERDPRRPLSDRTLDRAYPAGSTFKLVTAVAGLERNAASPDEEVTCTGRRIEGTRVLLDGVHGTNDFVAALAVSCNIYFWKIAERVGIDGIAEAARDLGFGASTGLDINRDVPGAMPDGTMLDSAGGGDIVPTLQAVIGGGGVRVTVIQLAMAYAAVANGGRLYAPQVVRRVQRAGDPVVRERGPVLRRRVNVSPTTLDLVRRGMWLAVNGARGTGAAARKGAIQMIGKTGTAYPPRLRPDTPGTPHAWFVGLAPADRPTIVVAVFIEKGGVGGKVAAPVARRIVDQFFRERRPRRKTLR